MARLDLDIVSRPAPISPIKRGLARRYNYQLSSGNKRVFARLVII